jgi:Fe2+ or Zn2+ uptake regulation protein
MSYNTASDDFERFLNSHNVIPTARRIKILKILFRMSNSEFSFGKIYDLMKKEESLASISSVASTLTLFKNTGLVREVNVPQYPMLSNRGKGRPERKYISVAPLKP